MKNLSRCRSCRTIVKLTAKEANESQLCCDNPMYVKVKPIHYLHAEAPGQVYCTLAKLNGTLARLMEAEDTPILPLRLACTAPARLPGTAAVTMIQAVTCPDCLEWIKNQQLPTTDISPPENLDQLISN